MEFITGKQAKSIIKGLGFDTSKISCTTRRGSLSLTVEVKDVSIPLEPIEDALRKFEKIHRCESTGEILQGCNRFVFIKYDWNTPPTEEMVDLYTLVLAMRGIPTSYGDNRHFLRNMMQNAPHLTESQCSQAFNAIHRNTLN